jgi:hypothetical protein
MNIPLLDKRVKSLEEMMADLIATVAQTSLEMREFKDEMKDFKDGVEIFQGEMKDFKDEMREFKDEMKDFKDEMREFKDEMKDFKDGVEIFQGEMKDFKDEMKDFKDGVEIFQGEMKDFKDEMIDYKAESLRERRRFNKELGAIANKQGRMTEDLVAPSICRILRSLFQIPRSFGCGMVPRVRRVHPTDRSRVREFDAIANCGPYVMVTEAKSTLRPSDIPELMATIKEFRDYFPEYNDNRVIGCLATLQVDESLVKYASREGILILAVGDELMDVMNEPGFKPREF